MPTREATDSLAHEIIESYEARAAGRASLRGEVITQRQATQALIKELDVTQRATARQLRKGLAEGRSDLAGGVTAQLNQLDATQRATARQLRKGLAKGRSDLAGGVTAQLNQLDATQRATARQLRVGLAKGRSDLADGVTAQLNQLDATQRATARQLRADLAKGHSDLADEVTAQLNQLDATQRATARQLQSHLTEARRSLIPSEGRRKSQVRAWINRVTATHAGARKAWQNLADLMERKRATPSGGVVKAPRPSYAAGGLLAAPGQINEIGLDEAVGNGEEDGSMAVLADRAFDYLAGHPDGARLTELERGVGLGRFQMNRVVKRLMDRGKVEKRELLYFAI